MMEPTPHDERSQDRNWLQYAAAALALVALSFLFTTFSNARPVTPGPTGEDIGYVTTGDMQVRLYVVQHYAPAGVRGQLGGDRPLREALRHYSSASRHRIALAIRRAGVVSEALGRDGMSHFNQLDSPAVLKDLPEPDKRELRREARMWRDVYTGKVTPRQAERLSEQIRDLQLGPVRYLALQQLYTRSGQPQLAARAVLEGRQRAFTSMLLFTLLSTVLLGAGIAGVYFLVKFFKGRLWERGAAEASFEEMDCREQTPAQPLFEGFVVYFALFWILSILIGGGAAALIADLPADRRVTWLALAVTAVTVLTGAAGLAAARSLAKGAGSSLVGAGFTLRDLWTNVLWGLAGYCVVLPVAFTSQLVWRAVQSAFFPDVQTRVNPVITMVLRADNIVLALLVVEGALLVPFVEEAFFGGMLYNGLRRRLRVAAAVVISSVAFGILHPFPGDFLPIAAIGAVFAVLMESRRSLVPCVIAHSLFNGVTFLMLVIGFLI